MLAAVLAAGAAQAPAQPGTGSSDAAGSSPKPSTESAGQRVVLKVGDLQITQAAFEQYLADLEAQQGPADLGRKKLGENYASMMALSQQAAADHLDSSPEVVRQLAIDRMQILSNAEFAKLKTEATPTPAQISAYYNAHLSDYDMVKILRVFIWSEQPGSKKPGSKEHIMTPQQADALAAAVRQAYKSGGDVGKVIKNTPHGPGDVVADDKPLTFEREELPGSMGTKVFELKEGEWTEFNNGPGTYVFIKVVQRTRRDLAEVTPRITKKLQAQKLREELSALKSKTGIWMDETYFASKATTPTTATEPEASGQSKSNK